MSKFFGRVFSVIVGNIVTIIVLTFILFLTIGILASIGSLFGKSNKIKDNSILELVLEEPIKESSMDNDLSLFSLVDESSVYLNDIIKIINHAAKNDKIKGISLKVESFKGGQSQLYDLRKALEEFKESGKFVYAYENNASQSAYILNSVADSLFQNPLGISMLQGLSSEVLFFKNLGDKYGIDFQVIRHGDYKSAVEPFLRDDLSPENREQLTVLLNDIWDNYSSLVSKSRKMSNDDWQKTVDSLYGLNPENMIKHKLADKLVQESEYLQALANRLNLEASEKETIFELLKKHTVGLDKYLSNIEIETSKDKIAILYASGEITEGDGFSGIQSETYKKAIRELKNNENIKAVVLRINSPGGSAGASEEILHELKELQKVKPLIASFGDLAASGGYYIAMGADSIFTNPNTLTGSIGVLGMIPNFKGAANNIGITSDYVNTNANSDFGRSPFIPASESALQQMSKMTEHVYKKFVSHVMSNRNMSFEQVDSIGGGRVWSGTQAKKLGLVDEFGGLQNAIDAAAKKANLEKYAIEKYPARKGDFDELMKEFKDSYAQSSIREELGSEYYKMYEQLKLIKERKGIQVIMPYQITIW